MFREGEAVLKHEMAVVGGSYGEECSFPRRRMLRGSGGRAAAVLSGLEVLVTLHTVHGPQLGREFQNIAKRFKYSVCAANYQTDVWFRYRFPLARPEIWPDFQLPRATQAAISADNALVFGMLEGRPPVNAKRVVYDPQDGARATHFESNGSTADELAIVASFSEAKALTGQTNPDLMADELLKQKGVTAVVIKCGPQGALVKTKTHAEWLRAFPTQRVYKIGSGDIFSAGFAYGWLFGGMNPFDAAWLASRLTAAYVESENDRFDLLHVADFSLQAAVARAKWASKSAAALPQKPIYLAGPFFDTAQQWRVDEVRGALLDMGFKVFSPIHDVEEGEASFVAKADLEGLKNSCLVLALLDEADPGTYFEVGYARARGIPVVGVAECVESKDLTMVQGSDCYVTDDLSTGIYAACWSVIGHA